MTPEEILTKAQEHIQNGWGKGSYEDVNGNVCSMGAIYKAAGMLDEKGGVKDLPMASVTYAIQALTNVVMDEVPGTSCVVVFNDYANTTQEDVLLMFKKAVEKARETGQ
jgi:hypothetical protein